MTDTPDTTDTTDNPDKPAPKSRAPRGNGTVFEAKRRGKTMWCAQISHYENGKRRFITGWGDSEKEAIAARQRNIRKRMTAPLPYKPAPKSLLLSVALDRWLAPRGQKLAEQSRRKYRNDVERHVIGNIGDKRLHQLTRDDFQKLFHTTLVEKAIGKSAIYHTFVNTNTFLNWCVFENYLTNNPLDKIVRPKKSNASEEKDTELIRPRKDMYLRVLRKLSEENHKYHEHYLLFLMLTLGLRRSELLGLEWHRIKSLGKPNGATLIVSQQLARYEKHEPKTGYYIHPSTKSGKVRKIYLPEEFRKALLAHKRQQKDISGQWSELIFRRADDKNLTYKDIQNIWQEVWRDYHGKNFERHYFRLHYVRHIAGSILLEKTNGNIAIVQDILGHSEAAMSLHYAHHMRDKRREATAGLAEGIFTTDEKEKS